MRFKKLQTAEKISPFQPLTPHGQKLLQQALQQARQHIPQMRSNIEGRVRENSGITYVINLEQRTCGCRAFQDEDTPCSHAIAAIYAIHQAPITYMPQHFQRTTYLQMYHQNLPPISLTDIQQVERHEENNQENNLPQSSAPVTRIQKGRPQKQRLRVGEPRIRNITCSTCGRVGHNARSCRNPHD